MKDPSNFDRCELPEFQSNEKIFSVSCFVDIAHSLLPPTVGVSGVGREPRLTHPDEEDDLPNKILVRHHVQCDAVADFCWKTCGHVTILYHPVLKVSSSKMVATVKSLRMNMCAHDS